MAWEMPGLTCSDGSLLFYLFSLAHSSIDIMYHGAELGQCERPIHVWLVISYISLVGLRVPHYLKNVGMDLGGMTDIDAAASAWKGFSKTALMMVWFALLPFFIVWTFIGSFWLGDVLHHTPTCLTSGTDPRFIIFWQVVCYGWILIYTVCVAIAFALKKRQGVAETNLREVETDDSRARWGSMSASWGLTPMLGLTAKEIQMLPAFTGSACGDGECSICLNEFQRGDAGRRLPSCGHCFHQSCIDLWLLRQNKCPLCKGDVVVNALPMCTPCVSPV